ncbi:MAG: hypothetical protein PHC28_05955 [Flavobacterium sp.]|uniref:hypothetical protein n=1 Tax=Flavobacterium sp. TaxID=239 RepID=UPI00262ABFB1|nr:hypothetical protein [Flavobacterium sp.]MDD5150013.1 hypothetical protein [Flavobacterium sp.]
MIGGSAATDLSEYSIKIDDTEISNFCMSTVIFQDIFSPSWVCEIYVADTSNLMMILPIKEKSKIEIQLGTQHNSITDDSKNFIFYVYGIADKVFKSVNDQNYTIIGVSEQFFKNQTIRIQKAFKNMAPTEIAQKVIKDKLGGNVEIDQCDNNITTTVSNLSPFHTAFKMCKFALIDKAADALFYQLDENKYAIKSIEKMYSDNDSGWTFKIRPNNLKDDLGNQIEDRNLCINDYNIDHYNLGTNMASGLYGSKTISFDFKSKSFTSKEFNYGDDISEDKKGIQLDDDISTTNANIRFIPKHTNIQQDKSTSDFVDKWGPSRRSSLMKLEQNKLIIQCPGAVGAWQILGKTVDIELPSNQSFVQEDLDPNLAGKYLVMAVAHFASASSYFTNYELAKKRVG